MNTKCTNIGSCLTADPENTEMSIIIELVKLTLVDSSNTELSLHGGDERGSLEKSTSQRLQSACQLGLSTWKLVVQSDDTNILLSCTLLRLDKSCCAINTDDQTPSDFRIQSTTVTSLLNSTELLAHEA
jgi:hypothetical protein